MANVMSLSFRAVFKFDSTVAKSSPALVYFSMQRDISPTLLNLPKSTPYKNPIANSAPNLIAYYFWGSARPVFPEVLYPSSTMIEAMPICLPNS